MLVDIFEKKQIKGRKYLNHHRDKMKNVKISVTPEQKRQVLRMQKRHGFDTTSDFVAAILRDGFDREYIMDLPKQEYKNTNLYIDTWLSAQEHDYLEDLSIEWITSIRNAAHRIFFHMLKGEVAV